MEIKSFFKEILNQKIELILATSLFLIAIYLMLLIPNIADNSITSPSPDLILDNINTIDLTYLFNFGFLIIIFSVAFISIFIYTKSLSYIGFQIAILMIVRQFFISLTSLQIHPESIKQEYFGIFQNFAFSNDLFFSGHVAIPFLAYLIFKNKNKIISNIYLTLSIIMGIVVLLMKVHYSIDVFAAPFITYGTYILVDKTYKKMKNEKKRTN